MLSSSVPILRIVDMICRKLSIFYWLIQLLLYFNHLHLKIGFKKKKIKRDYCPREHMVV